MLFKSYRDVPPDRWRWANFSPREIACKGTGSVLINEDALDKLQELREALGRPLVLTSAYRSPSHNKAVGGAKGSYHLQGRAFDVRMENHDPEHFERAARRVGFTGFGYYPRQGFMHIDTGPARSWGDSFPASATGLTPEPAKRTSIAKSSTVQASTVQLATAATAAGGAVGALDGTAQVVALAIAGVVALAALWILRERIKAWSEGWR